jgi:hypothetical protein
MFSDDAIALIHTSSRGKPRSVNLSLASVMGPGSCHDLGTA